MSKTREKFATQVDAEILSAVRKLADLIEKHNSARPRPHIMAAYLASHEKYGPLYKKLAQ